MTKRRRRFTPSLWIDTLRHRRATKSIRWSSKRTGYGNDETEQSRGLEMENRLTSQTQSLHCPDLGDDNVCMGSVSDLGDPHRLVDSVPAPGVSMSEVRGLHRCTEREAEREADNAVDPDLDPEPSSVLGTEPESHHAQGIISEDPRGEGGEFRPFGDDAEERRAVDPSSIIEDIHANASGGPFNTQEDVELQAQLTSSSNQVENILKELGDLLQIWKNHLSLSALIAVVGRVRFTVDQYDYTRNILQDAGANPTWPPYARTQRYFQKIVNKCLPKSVIVNLPAGATPSQSEELSEGDSQLNGMDSADLDKGRTERDSQPKVSVTERVRIFLPSSWAQLDVANPFVFDQIFPQFRNESSTFHSLEESPAIRDRSSITSSCDFFYARKDVQVVACLPGTIVALTVQSSVPSFQTTFKITTTECHHLLEGVVAATWSVGGEQKINCSGKRALNLPSLSPRHRSIIYFLSTAEAPKTNDDHTIGVLPGDLCTLLTSNPIDIVMFPVLIHRFWKQVDGKPSMSLLWLKQSSSTTQEQLRSGQADRLQGSMPITIQSFVVEDVKAITLSSVSQPRSDPEQGHYFPSGARSHGILMSGVPFIIYRILLYCDDFRKSSAMSPKGSAGGCYFLPLSLPPESRRNTSSVRLISLTPPGISTNHVLHYIADDLATAATTGVNGYTPSGQKVKIFLDVVGFVGDYPASAAVVDVIGHMCREPCTVCSFRRLQDAGTAGSRFGYTTNVPSNNSAFMRHGERHRSLRNSGLTDEDANRLGMVAKEKYSETRCPLIHLQTVFESRESSSALTSDGVPVVPSRFDAFRCNLIAPDHLLTGLTKDILNAMFRTLPTNDLSTEADIRICDAMRSNGLLCQKQVFNLDRKMLNSMTLSELFCVLLVSVPTMKLVLNGFAQNHIIQDCFRLLGTFQRLVSLTYWWPVRELDGQRAVCLVREERERYFADMKAISKRYVQEVDKICSRSDVIKQQLDKPNLHRLIELYEHAVPARGHVREFMELVFESAHQPLKRCISRSNNHDAHLYAVEHCVGNDWQGRIAALLDTMSDEDENIQTEARRGLRRVLLGELADMIPEDENVGSLREIDSTIEMLFTPALRKQFQKDSMTSNFSSTTISTSRARKKTNTEYLCSHLNVTSTDSKKILQTSRAWISALYPAIKRNKDELEPTLNLFKDARYLKLNRSGRQLGKQGKYGILTVNSCVKVYLDPSSIHKKIITSNPTSIPARTFFFAILAVLQRQEEIPFAICLRCERNEEIIKVGPSPEINSFQLLRLTQDIEYDG